MCEPIGLVGLANAGSLRSTSVCVTTHDRLAPDAAAPERVAQRLEEHVADRALDVGAGVVHRHRRHLGDGELRAAQDEADLRAVAVRDHHLPAALDHAGDVLGERAHHRVLVGDRLVLASRISALPPIASDGESGLFASLRAPRPVQRRPAVKHASGARVMPAPIWPTPGSLCAMPVLMTGSMPVSTTRRASMPAGVPREDRAPAA